MSPKFNGNISHIIACLIVFWMSVRNELDERRLLRRFICIQQNGNSSILNEMNWKWQRTKWINICRMCDEQNSISLLCVRKSIYPTINDLSELSYKKDLSLMFSKSKWIYFGNRLNASILWIIDIYNFAHRRYLDLDINSY